MTVYRTLASLSVASTVLFALAPQALADVNADAVFDGLKRQMALQGAQLAAESVELRGGDDIVLSGVSVNAPSGEQAFKIDMILLEDVAEADNGAYVIGRIAAPAFTSENDGYTLAFEGATVEGYYVAGPEETDPIAKAGVYRGVTIGGIAVAKGSAPIFTLDGMTATMSEYKPGGTMEYDVDVKDFTVDFNQIDDPKTRSAMTELGYGTLTGRVTGEGMWNTSTGEASMVQSIVIDEAATLNMDVAVGGYTPELVAALQEMNAQMKDQSDEAVGLAMLGLMQQLQIGNISIELVDDSVTGRALDFVAKQQGTNRANIIAQAKGTLPFALAQLKNPEFAAKVSAAVGAFLDNPGTLKIAASPANPVPVAQIMAAAMTAPQSVIGVLGVTVSANE